MWGVCACDLPGPKMFGVSEYRRSEITDCDEIYVISAISFTSHIVYRVRSVGSG